MKAELRNGVSTATKRSERPEIAGHTLSSEQNHNRRASEVLLSKTGRIPSRRTRPRTPGLTTSQKHWSPPLPRRARWRAAAPFGLAQVNRSGKGAPHRDHPPSIRPYPLPRAVSAKLSQRFLWLALDFARTVGDFPRGRTRRVRDVCLCLKVTLSERESGRPPAAHR
jgi:hypothetical protein